MQLIYKTFEHSMKMKLKLKFFILAVCFIAGGITPNVCAQTSSTEANELIQKANNGDSESAWLLGNYYLEGKVNGRKDEVEGVRWLKKAAECGNQYSMDDLGAYYEEKGDYGEAVKWYTRAYEAGDKKSAPYYLSRIFSKHGLNGTPDYEEAVKWYKVSAENGDRTAMSTLGDMYNWGEKIKADYAEAIKWYKKGDDNNYDYCQWRLGEMYLEGKGTPKDPVKAFALFKKAGENGLQYAQYMTGECYLNGSGVAKNASEAVKWFKKAAEQENGKAQYALGQCYNKGTGVAKDKAESVKWIEKALNNRNFSLPTAEQHKAFYLLGECYENGDGVKVDYSKALGFYEKAFTLPEAKIKEGKFHIEGKGCTKNAKLGAGYISSQASRGNAQALYELGELYKLGEGVETDFAKATELFTEASGKGYTPAMNALGLMKEMGFNETEALKWYKKAAALGDADGMYNAGYLYFFGHSRNDEFPENKPAAVLWFKKAAEKGHARAQYYLGLCYYEGMGTPKNIPMALQWWKKAAKQNQSEAEYALGYYYLIEKKMNDEGLTYLMNAAIHGSRQAKDLLI